MNLDKRLQKLEGLIGGADDEPRFTWLDILLSEKDPDHFKTMKPLPPGKGYTAREWRAVFEAINSGARVCAVR